MQQRVESSEQNELKEIYDALVSAVNGEIANREQDKVKGSTSL